MASFLTSRRDLLLSGAALGVVGAAAAITIATRQGETVAVPGADGTIDLVWEDLIPGGYDALDQTLQDLGVHDLTAAMGVQDQSEAALAVTHAYDGKRVRIPGYMVPLDFESVSVRDFLLVPYIGACIHVPPPPPNQIIMVHAAVPYETLGYFEPVYVEGALQTQSMSTDLADVGYTIPDADVTPYG